MSEFDTKVREQVGRFIVGLQTAEALEEWLVSNMWDEESGLAADVDHLLVERGVLDEEALKERLYVLISTVRTEEGATQLLGTAVTRSAPSVTIHGRHGATAELVVVAGLELAGR